jgi:hypothetical protein
VGLTATQEYYWRIALELKMRKAQGDAFQDFFCTVMEAVHSSDFVRVRPFGQLGDKGCDGYLISDGSVYQCYGALDGGSGRTVSYLIAKMRDDFCKALRHIPEIMKEWHMVHNFVGGLPVEAVQELERLRSQAGNRVLGFKGIAFFESQIFSLDPMKIEVLLGPVATANDFQNLQAAELRDLIAAFASAASSAPLEAKTIRPVPLDKLDFNNLSNHWRRFVSAGCQNSHYVATYLNHHSDPLMGEKIAQMFRDRYRYLKTEQLSPSDIMTQLYEMVVGPSVVSPQRMVAAQALLAFLS